MATGLVLRIESGGVTTERTFARPPVIIGREESEAECVLFDPNVSKAHACIDVLEGRIGVRDNASTNGTFVGGVRLAPNCWVRPGAAGEPLQVTIGRHSIVAFTFELDPAPDSHSLAEFVRAVPRSGSTLATEGLPLQKPPPPETMQPGTFRMQEPVVRLAFAYVNALAGMEAFRNTLVQELTAAPPTARPTICESLVRDYPMLMDDPGTRGVLERFSGVPQRPAAPALAEGALAAMQELAEWYLGRGRSLAAPGEIEAFKANIRAALDEFFLGYPPLVESMSRFQQQVAVRGDAASALSPAQLAASLLDWMQDTGAFRDRLRSSFAELRMHQTALLNGIMGGVVALLAELSPAQIEKAAAGTRQGLFGHADPWAVYKRRHSDLADEENERFRVLFGPDFVDEYRQFTREGGAKK